MSWLLPQLHVVLPGSIRTVGQPDAYKATLARNRRWRRSPAGQAWLERTREHRNAVKRARNALNRDKERARNARYRASPAYQAYLERTREQRNAASREWYRKNGRKS